MGYLEFIFKSICGISEREKTYKINRLDQKLNIKKLKSISIYKHGHETAVEKITKG